MEPVEIKVRDHGPYKVTGPVRLVDPEGREWALAAGESVVLCRCGHSREKPFCDRSHREAGFRSVERASPSGVGNDRPPPSALPPSPPE